jgi:hypothetical protein
MYYLLILFEVQIARIRNLSGSKVLFPCKKGGNDDAHVSRPVHDWTKVGILSTKHVIGRDNEGFGTTETSHFKVGIYGKVETGSSRNGLFYVPIELLEGGQRRDAHPDNEMLVQNSFKRTDHHAVCLHTDAHARKSEKRLLNNPCTLQKLHPFGGTYFIEILCRIVIGVKVAIARAVFHLIRGRARPVVSFATRRVTLTGTWLGIESLWLSKQVLHIAGPRNARFLHEEGDISIGRNTRGEFDHVIEHCIGNETAGVELNATQVIEWVAVGGSFQGTQQLECGV